MSGPDDPRWLGEIADEMRREVPVRPAWRARLLDDVAHAPSRRRPMTSMSGSTTTSRSSGVSERSVDPLRSVRPWGSRPLHYW